jgi:NAD(P)-dependent dehydrogenase (short-subunit alcohol dehydrogenase family)
MYPTCASSSENTFRNTTVSRTVIITGADSGIGRATAVAFAEEGYDVGFTFLDDLDGARRTAELARKAGQRVEMLSMDLSDPSDGSRAVDQLAAALHGLDVFVNNAATAFSAPVLETRLPDWQRVLMVNLTGAFACMQAAARHMVATGTPGRIIAVTSIQQEFPNPGSAAYGAAKAGLGLLTKVMALELGRYGITVNAVAPGEIATTMTGMEDVDPTTVSRPNLPLGRPGSPREIAELIVWLASGSSSYATGASFVVDGGAALMGPYLSGQPEQIGRSLKELP